MSTAVVTTEGASRTVSLRRKKVLITGATGFIGGRVAEVLSQIGVPCTVLVRTWKRAARLSRLPLQMIGGDVLNPSAIREAMAGCDAVVHAVVDNRIGGKAHRKTSAVGTGNVMDAALRCGVRRVVHLSSVAVYSYAPRPDAATEEGRYRYSGDAYCDGKIDSERVALRYARRERLPVTVLRPTVVYGPFGPLSSDLVTSLRERKLALLEGGRGVCNTLYIDNLVQAILLSLNEDETRGEVYHVSDSRPVTWKDFLEAHASLISGGLLPLSEATPENLRIVLPAGGWFPSIARVKDILRDPKAQFMLQTIPVVRRYQRWKKRMSEFLPGPWKARPVVENATEPMFKMTRAEADIYRCGVAFSIEKAKRRLGYIPNISFEEGMRRTAEWLRWARLVP